MKSITYEEFLKFNPCWLKTEEGAARLKKIGAQKERWTALNILALDDVSAEDKLWAVLREELIDVRTLHEFACWCAEEALSHVENADERSWNVIKVKRAWLRGEASDAELSAARAAAWTAARDAAEAAAWIAAGAAIWDVAESSAWYATLTTARAAAGDTARAAAWYAVLAATRYVARERQAEHLKGMLMEEER